jgi:hypothetical protein
MRRIVRRAGATLCGPYPKAMEIGENASMKNKTENAMSLSERVQIILQEMEGREHGKKAALARIARCSGPVINHWVNGTQEEMNFEHATRIANELGYRVQWIMNGTGPKRVGEQNVEPIAVKPGHTPAASVATEQKIPTQDEEMFLVHVNLDELRLLTSYREKRDCRWAFDTATAFANAHGVDEVK